MLDTWLVLCVFTESVHKVWHWDCKQSEETPVAVQNLQWTERGTFLHYLISDLYNRLMRGPFLSKESKPHSYTTFKHIYRVELGKQSSELWCRTKQPVIILITIRTRKKKCNAYLVQDCWQQSGFVSLSIHNTHTLSVVTIPRPSNTCDLTVDVFVVAVVDLI